MSHRTAPTLPEVSSPPGPTFRSAAVARMAQMPVATLRIWEQRYRAVQPATATTGHRLYSAADVQRVLVLRQLTGQGHAIGSIAGLDTAQLQQLQDVQQAADQAWQATAAATAPARATSHPVGGMRRTPWRVTRVVVVGPALALRLQRVAVVRALSDRARVVAVFGSVTEAAQADPATPADLLLWYAPTLTAESPPDLAAARDACGARQVAIVYRYAGSAATQALRASGAAVVREPADDEALADWVASLASSPALAPLEDGPTPGPDVGPTGDTATPPPPSAPGTVAPRRYDDAMLTAIAGLSPTLACECPRHLAELLMQISSFETYSEACVHRNAADAALHAYLHQVAATSRAMFETALERVARHEGLPLRSTR